MKAKTKTDLLQEEADKIEHIPEEKDNGRNGQEKPSKAKKPRKNRFLERLRKTWARITGCMRSCTTIQEERSAEELPTPSEINMEEELPTPSGLNLEEELSTLSGIIMEEKLPEPSRTNMEDTKANVSFEEQEKEDDVEENQNIDTNNEKVELVTDKFVEQQIQAEYQHLNDLIHSLEDLCAQYYATNLEILAEYNRINDQIQSLEDLYIQYYNTEDEQQNGEEQLLSNLEDCKVKIKEVEEDGLKELREPSSTDIEDPKANLSYEEQERELDVEEKQNIETNNEEAELVTDSFVEQEIQAEYQRLNDLIHSQENLCAQYYATQWEILAEYNCINDQIQNLENLYIQHYNAEDEQNEEEQLEINVEDNQEVKNKEVEEDGLKNSESTKNSQRASCEMPGPSHFNSRGNELSKGKGKDDDKGENTSIKINNKREECRSEESSRKSCSLEEELHETIKTSQSGSSEYKSDSCPLEEETPEKLQKSTNNSQSGSSHDEEPSTSNICMEKPEQPGEGTPATVPLTLQSFTFHRTLGEGGFGKAYLARDIIRKECVAIKVMKKRYFTGRAHNFVERNILELSHESPHLIHGLAAFHTKQYVYYVMELATRGDLCNFMRKNYRLYHPSIQFIISEVICGTQFLHKKGIIHRDLKPENILLCTDGHVKIADFGLATMDANERNKRRCVGTVTYMAPEMVRRQEHGEGVDYFAIGVILYEMYTGKVPFTGRDANDIKLAILLYTPKYPEFLTPETVNILLGLLHKNQHHRLGVEGDVRKHPYFSNINWEDVEARRLIPPPVMTAASVHQNMDQTLDYAEKPNRIRSKHQQIFKDFSFICPEWSQQYHLIDNIETRSWMAKLFARRPFK